MMDTTSGGALETLRSNQSHFEDELNTLKSNTTDYQEPTVNELSRLADILEKSKTFTEVGFASHVGWFMSENFEKFKNTYLYFRFRTQFHPM